MRGSGGNSLARVFASQVRDHSAAFGVRDSMLSAYKVPRLYVDKPEHIRSMTWASAVTFFSGHVAGMGGIVHNRTSSLHHHSDYHLSLSLPLCVSAQSSHVVHNIARMHNNACMRVTCATQNNQHRGAINHCQKMPAHIHTFHLFRQRSLEQAKNQPVFFSFSVLINDAPPNLLPPAPTQCLMHE